VLTQSGNSISIFRLCCRLLRTLLPVRLLVNLRCDSNRLTKPKRSADVWKQEKKDEITSCLTAFGCKLVVQEHACQDTDGDENAWKGQSRLSISPRYLPYGTCISVVTKVLNPKPLMMIVPKFDIPPFCKTLRQHKPQGNLGSGRRDRNVADDAQEEEKIGFVTVVMSMVSMVAQ
jgi:hypothetical protein